MNTNTVLQVVWVKREFRIYDNECLHNASLMGPVLVIYCFEPDLWRQDDVSYRHYMFIKDCVIDLMQQLTKINGYINIYNMPMVELLSTLKFKYGTFNLWSHQETGNQWTYERDNKVREWCKVEGVKFTEPLQFGVWRGSRINRDTWAKDWDAMMLQDTYPMPTHSKFVIEKENKIPEPSELGIEDDGIVTIQRGGRQNAMKILNSFLNVRGEHYQTDMSSPISGEDGCSRMSPHIAYGCVSMREVYQQTLARRQSVQELSKDKQGNWPRSLQSFIGRLHWHCHFTQKLELEPEIEWLPMSRAYVDLRPFDGIDDKLYAFANGQTGYPFVDACMRYLKATGWINFRMRAMLMSFASYDLFIPWQKSGEILARLFTDYEAGIHWPQVQMQSGVTGINSIRIYSPIKQGLDQDPTGIFTRKWVPELALVPDKILQTPWKFSGNVSYPAPIVEHDDAIKYARSKIWEIKKTEQAKAEAEAVYLKHGSRKQVSRKRASSKKK